MRHAIALTLHGVDDLREVVRRLEAFLNEAAFPASRSEDVRTAVEEACRNALEHGDASHGPPTVMLTWHDNTASVRIRSAGPPFEIPEAKPDLHRKLEGLDSPRGWGLFLIRSLADTVHLRSHDGWNDMLLTFSPTSEERDKAHG